MAPPALPCCGVERRRPRLSSKPCLISHCQRSQERKPLDSRQRLARVVKGRDPGTLFVEVPAPNKALEEGLWISTDRGEITIGVDMFHTHYGSYSESDERTAAQAVNFIRKFLNEQYVIGIEMDGKTLIGILLIEIGGKPDFILGDRVQILSWRGTYDCEL